MPTPIERRGDRGAQLQSLESWGLPWYETIEDRFDPRQPRRSSTRTTHGLKPSGAHRETWRFKALTKSQGAGALFRGAARRGDDDSLAKSIARATAESSCGLVAGVVRDERRFRGHSRTHRCAAGEYRAEPAEGEHQQSLIFARTRSTICRPLRGDPAAALLKFWTPDQNQPSSTTTARSRLDLSDVKFIPRQYAERHSLRSRPDGDHLSCPVHRVRSSTSLSVLEIVRQRKKAGWKTCRSPSHGDANPDDCAPLHEGSGGPLALARARLASAAGRASRSREDRRSAHGGAVELVAELLHKYRGGRNIGLAEEKKDEIGLPQRRKTRLAVTQYWGDLLLAEVTVVPANGSSLTVKLGDVMQSRRRPR